MLKSYPVAVYSSINVQKLSLVFRNGISQLDGKQKTIGIGYAKGLVIGVAKSKTKGAQQTGLSICRGNRSPPAISYVKKYSHISGIRSRQKINLA